MLQVVFDGFINNKSVILLNPIKEQISTYLREKDQEKKNANKISNDTNMVLFSSNVTPPSNMSTKENICICTNEDLKVEPNKKKKKSNQFVKIQLIDNEYIARIEILCKENLQLKAENSKLNEKLHFQHELVLSRETEIAKLRSNIVKFN